MARAEGGAVVDSWGRVVGMAVSGPRRRVLPSQRRRSTGLSTSSRPRDMSAAGISAPDFSMCVSRTNETPPAGREHGILIVSIDPDGPAARVGLVIGDIMTAWNAQPLTRVRDVMRLLGPDSVGNTIDLQPVARRSTESPQDCDRRTAVGIMSRAHGAAASLVGLRTPMVAVAIYSADPALRPRLETAVALRTGLYSRQRQSFQKAVEIFRSAGNAGATATAQRLVEKRLQRFRSRVVTLRTSYGVVINLLRGSCPLAVFCRQQHSSPHGH
jgi:PDZ domain